MKVYLKDYWLWSQVRICQDNCEHCGSGCSITIRKKDIKKLIRILEKLNYKKLPKRLDYSDKEYLLFEDGKLE